MQHIITTAETGLAAVMAVAKLPSRLAAALGIRPQAISQWRKIPVGRVLQIEEIFGVPPHIQRPDLYRNPVDGSVNAACIPTSGDTASQTSEPSQHPTPDISATLAGAHKQDAEVGR